MKINQLISNSLNPLPQDANPWVSLFKNCASPRTLMALLAANVVPITDASLAGELRDAFVAWLVKNPHLNHQKTDSTHNFNANPFPGTLEEAWPQPSKDIQSSRSECAGHVLGRLVAATGGIGDTSPDALDIALREGWTPVVRQILKHFTPSAKHLNKKEDVVYEKGVTVKQPWLHTLAGANRVMEMSDWLAIEGVKPVAVCSQGKTALFHVRSLDAMNLLLENGVDISAEEHNGQTAGVYWMRNRHSLDPLFDSNKKAMEDRLNTAMNQGSDPLKNVISLTLNQWINPYHGPEIERLPKEIKTAIGLSKTRITTKKTITEWGPVAYLGLNLPYLQANSVFDRWKHFVEHVPEAWLTRESVPGVQDGWILAVNLFNQAKSHSSPLHGTHIARLFYTLARRLMPDVSHEDHNSIVVGHVVRATNAMLARQDEKKKRHHQSRIFQEILADCNAPLLKEVWNRLPTHDLWGEAIVEGLIASYLHEYIVPISSVLLQKLTPEVLKHALRDDSKLQPFWENLLTAYGTLIDGKKEKLARLDTKKERENLFFIMESLTQQGKVPAKLNSKLIKRRLSALRAGAPATASALEAVLLNNRLSTPTPTCAPRRRM